MTVLQNSCVKIIIYGCLLLHCQVDLLDLVLNDSDRICTTEAYQLPAELPCEKLEGANWGSGYQLTRR